jgi:hypothetical protein
MKPNEYAALKREFCVATHVDLAKKIGVHLKTVQGWSRGISLPSRISLLRIEAAREKLASEGK